LKRRQEDGTDDRLANDTSIGAGYAPMSDLENVVVAVEARLNASEVKAA
jgi:S-adenosylmethionine synthetase